MPLDRVNYVDTHDKFYQEGFRKLISVAFVFTALAYGLLGVIVYQYFAQPIPKYFVATSDGRLIEIYSLAQLQAMREQAQPQEQPPAQP